MQLMRQRGLLRHRRGLSQGSHWLRRRARQVQLLLRLRLRAGGRGGRGKTLARHLHWHRLPLHHRLELTHWSWRGYALRHGGVRPRFLQVEGRLGHGHGGARKGPGRLLHGQLSFLLRVRRHGHGHRGHGGVAQAPLQRLRLEPRHLLLLRLIGARRRQHRLRRGRPGLIDSRVRGQR